jgi:hypothetical protein
MKFIDTFLDKITMYRLVLYYLLLLIAIASIFGFIVVPDFMERTFYLSGPRTMVTAYENTLKSMGVHSHQIKTDFFPGFV